ncbi:MAG: SMC-Scp complex subunit ScpB [Gammaproteobacteria bacterium]|nr:SMC-Scp complex subunit ScpB [Gammaproteobacteria bacterium]
MMEISRLKNILEAILLAADHSLNVFQLEALFELDEERPTRDEIRKALHEMTEDSADRGYEVKEVASGYRLQVKQEFATWVGRLWEEKPARYTRALLETMALIAYRQPVTRGEIEEVRGVSVSSNIIKTLLERDWIKVLGHKDVPGKPSLYGTTKEFLDYFNLKKLDDLPTLAEIRDLDAIHPELRLDEDAPHEKTHDSDSDESGSGPQTDIEDTSETGSSADHSESDLNGEAVASKMQQDADGHDDTDTDTDERVQTILDETEDLDDDATRQAYNV